nr:immunoglobulin heavy chain junction region [Mus musculus]
YCARSTWDGYWYFDV